MKQEIEVYGISILGRIQNKAKWVTWSKVAPLNTRSDLQRRLSIPIILLVCEIEMFMSVLHSLNFKTSSKICLKMNTTNLKVHFFSSSILFALQCLIHNDKENSVRKRDRRTKLLTSNFSTSCFWKLPYIILHALLVWISSKKEKNIERWEGLKYL